MRTWLLLRGLARESGHWGDFVARLQASLPGDRAVALDLPGTGSQRGVPSPSRIDAIAAACQAQALRRGLAPPYHLVGMSLGGMVAMRWLLQRPADVSGCVLINSSLRELSPWHHRLRPAAVARLLAALAASDAERAEWRILQLTSNVASLRADAWPAWTILRRERPVRAGNAWRQLFAAARFRLTEGRPQCPVLVLCGAGDRVVDPRCSEALACHWRCELAVHPAAGHDLALDDAEWVCGHIVRTFGGAGHESGATRSGSDGPGAR